MLMKRIIPVFATTLLLMSCYQEIDIEKYREKPKIVMQGFVSDEGIKATLSKSWFVKDGRPADCGLDNANVMLFVDGKNEGTVPRSGKGTYELKRKFNPGNNIRIEVSDKGMDGISSEVTVPQPPVIENSECTFENNSENGTGRFSFRLKFHDDPHTEDYYAICLEYMELTADEEFNLFSKRLLDMDIKDEPLLKPEIGIFEDWISDGTPEYDGFYIFNDRKINGQSYTLNLSAYIYMYLQEKQLKIIQTEEGRVPQDATCRLSIKLMKISEGYYRYCDSMSKDAIDEFGSIGLAEPVKIYSNIAGGIGILGAYTAASIETYLTAEPD